MYLVWTEEKINKFKNMYPTASWEELEKEFGIKKNSLVHKAKDLKVKRQSGIDGKNRNSFTKEEKDFIIFNYKKLTAKKIADKLGRKEQAIFAFWSNNKISADALWTEKDEELFKEVYPKYTNEYLIKHYFPKRTVSALINEAQKLKITKMGGKGLKQYDKEDIVEQYYNVIETIGRFPFYTETSKYNLASTKTINRYFNMSYSEFANYLGFEVKKNMYGNNSTLFSNNCCFSQQERMIQNFLDKNNIEYDKEVYYYTVMPQEECGLKRFDWKINNTYVEFFGLKGVPLYDKKTEKKISLCKKYNIDLIEIYPKDIDTTSYEENLRYIFKKFIK